MRPRRRQHGRLKMQLGPRAPGGASSSHAEVRENLLPRRGLGDSRGRVRLGDALRTAKRLEAKGSVQKHRPFNARGRGEEFAVEQAGPAVTPSFARRGVERYRFVTTLHVSQLRRARRGEPRDVASRVARPTTAPPGAPSPPTESPGVAGCSGIGGRVAGIGGRVASERVAGSRRNTQKLPDRCSAR